MQQHFRQHTRIDTNTHTHTHTEANKTWRTEVVGCGLQSCQPKRWDNPLNCHRYRYHRRCHANAQQLSVQTPTTVKFIKIARMHTHAQPHTFAHTRIDTYIDSQIVEQLSTVSHLEMLQLVIVGYQLLLVISCCVLLLLPTEAFQLVEVISIVSGFFVGTKAEMQLQRHWSI